MQPLSSAGPATTPLSHHTRQVLHQVEDWLNVERRQLLSSQQKQGLGQQVQHGLDTIEHQTHQFLCNELAITAQTSPVAEKLFGNLNRTLQGKPQLSWALTHALAFMYLPGSIIAPLMMNAQYKRLGTLDDDSRHKLINQYGAERAIGAALHFLPIYGGKLFADGVKLVAQQHLPLRQWANRAEQQGRTPALVTQAAHGLAAGLRQTWHSLNDTRGDTAFSIGMMVLFNTVGYGFIRPWITANTTALTFARVASASADKAGASALHPVSGPAIVAPLPAYSSSPVSPPLVRTALPVTPNNTLSPFVLNKQVTDCQMSRPVLG